MYAALLNCPMKYKSSNAFEIKSKFKFFFLTLYACSIFVRRNKDFHQKVALWILWLIVY